MHEEFFSQGRFGFVHDVIQALGRDAVDAVLLLEATAKARVRDGEFRQEHLPVRRRFFRRDVPGSGVVVADFFIAPFFKRFAKVSARSERSPTIIREG